MNNTRARWTLGVMFAVSGIKIKTYNSRVEALYRLESLAKTYGRLIDRDFVDLTERGARMSCAQIWPVEGTTPDMWR